MISIAVARFLRDFRNSGHTYHLVTEHYSILPAGCTPQEGHGITTCDVYN